MKNKRILITGDTGMISRELIELVRQDNEITGVSLDEIGVEGINHIRADLTEKKICQELCKDKDIVFHLSGIKSNPQTALAKPASFFRMVQFNANMMEAALQNNCEHFFYTSSVGVYGQSPDGIFREEDGRLGGASPNDFFAGSFKFLGEMQAEAYKIEYGWTNYSVGRPTSIYGNFDSFDLAHCMVIPALIRKMSDHPNIDLELTGRHNIRDFLHAHDCARAILHMVENKLTGPLNIGSGTGCTIEGLASCIAYHTSFGGSIKWKDGPSGDKVRLMDISKLEATGFQNKISLNSGIKSTVKWYKENKDQLKNRFNYFK